MSPTRHDPSHVSAVGTVTATERTSALSRPGRERRPALSIIIPAKNEAASLPQLVAEIVDAFRPLVARQCEGNPLEFFEILIVDDGSTDDTQVVLKRLAVETPELRAIVLAKNAGQSAATACGFREAKGDWVAILDADLQNDPADLAKLWDVLPGHDAALGWRLKREDVWSKRIISKWANRARNWMLGQSIKDTGCAVRIFPRDVALRFPMFHGAHRFYGPFLLREGCSIVQMGVHHRARPHGMSHYNIWNRSTKVVIDLFGVAWLMRRPIRCDVATIVGGEAHRPYYPPRNSTPQEQGSRVSAERRS